MWSSGWEGPQDGQNDPRLDEAVAASFLATRDALGGHDALLDPLDVGGRVAVDARGGGEAAVRLDDRCFGETLHDEGGKISIDDQYGVNSVCGPHLADLPRSARVCQCSE